LKNVTCIPIIHELVDVKQNFEEEKINKNNNKETIYINQCSKCKKILSSKKCLQDHEINCKGVHSLQCPKCMKEFTTPQGKSKHLKNVTCISINPNYSI